MDSFCGMWRRHCVILLAILCLPIMLLAQDRLLDLLGDELNREMMALKAEETPPYFISYTVSDVHNASVSASFGALTDSYSSDYRALLVMVRAGDYQLDNTHELRGDPFSRSSFHSGGFIRMALDENPDAIRAALWQETDRQYRQAVERLMRVKANVATKVAAEDTSADFSRESEIASDYESPVDIKALLGDQKIWEEKVKKYSAPFLEKKDIFGGQASFNFSVERTNLVTTEGTRIAQNLIYAQVAISGFIKSEDGMELPLYRTYSASKPDDLPDDEQILADVREMINKLEALRNAPAVEPYTGPAILSGRASGVFFHEVFGHRVEGHRQKSEEEGQTFKKKIGEQILPESMQVIFDPTLKKHKGFELVGCYKYDDEGIKAQRVPVVESGVFKSFLMSRSPIENFPRSNGHGRAQAGYRPISRQSNMLIESTAAIAEQQLRQKLIDECKKQGKQFGLLFQDIQGGFTMTGRTMPNVFNVIPTEVYRVYTDGRPDELVRGVDLVGTPLVMFSMISDASDQFDVFSGICGAESGIVPVSAVAPSLLVTQVEVQKKSKSQERPPILSRPDAK
ncbi:MAG: TldD/PmbA family protein [bacterium]|nr:MAG: TldD/PmbA family protein [bacterium]